MSMAKAYVAAATAFLSLAAAREVHLLWWVEALIAATIAGVAVYATRNSEPS